MTAWGVEAGVYWATLLLFGFVVVASACMRHDMLLLACIPPVFVAMIAGFTMTLYAAESFGSPPTAIALLLGGSSGWRAARRFPPRTLLLAIYAGWCGALVLAFVAFGFPDRP